MVAGSSSSPVVGILAAVAIRLLSANRVACGKLFFGGLGVTILGGCFMDNRLRQEFGMPVLLIGCAMIVGSAVYAVIATRLLWAKRIDPYFAWIKGACPDYLAELPDLPLPSNSPYPPR